MKSFITYSNVTEAKVHEFYTEASTIGLRPGEWPSKLETELGNKMPFHRVRPNFRDGELQSVRYDQVCGCIQLTVYND